jgi:hypothetical protein
VLIYKLQIQGGIILDISHARVMNLVTQHVGNGQKYVFEVDTLKNKEVIIFIQENFKGEINLKTLLQELLPLTYKM